MRQSFQAIQLIVLGRETALTGYPVIQQRDGAREGSRQAVFRVPDRVNQAVTGLPESWCHIGLQFQRVHGLRDGRRHTGFFIGFAAPAPLRAYRPGRWHVGTFRVCSQHPLHQAHTADAINHGVMHLGVQGKAIVFQPLDDMAFPQRAGKIQGIGVQARHQDAKLPLAARARQG